LEPMTIEFFDKPFSKIALIVQTLRLLPKAIKEKIKPLDDKAKIDLALTPSGVFDGFSPVSLDDKVDLPQRILPLWSLPNKTNMEAAGSNHGAMLGSNGGSPDMLHIIHAIKQISDLAGGTKLQHAHDDTYFIPLLEYIKTLQPPHNMLVQSRTQVEDGKKIFTESCAACHNGPDYAGVNLHDVADIGTDANIKQILDPELSGSPVFPIGQPYELTQSIRAARLSGVWSMKRLLHNGSLSSLDELFCLEGPRPVSLPIGGMSTAGHEFGCESLNRGQKEDLLAFLRSL